MLYSTFILPLFNLESFRFATGGEHVIPGNIIIRQRGFKFDAGDNVGVGRDQTIYSLIEGHVKFQYSNLSKKSKVHVVPCFKYGWLSCANCSSIMYARCIEPFLKFSQVLFVSTKLSRLVRRGSWTLQWECLVRPNSPIVWQAMQVLKSLMTSQRLQSASVKKLPRRSCRCCPPRHDCQASAGISQNDSSRLRKSELRFVLRRGDIGLTISTFYRLRDVSWMRGVVPSSLQRLFLTMTIVYGGQPRASIRNNSDHRTECVTLHRASD